MIPPPLLGFSDTPNIAIAVDSIFLVVRAGETRREFVKSSLDQIRQVRANLNGIILNALSRKSSSYYGYYNRYYSNYYGARDERGEDAQKELNES